MEDITFSKIADFSKVIWIIRWEILGEALSQKLLYFWNKFTSVSFNPLQRGVPFLNPQKTSENL